ncbi:MAG: HAD family phosphatase [Candidatus Curtissbacteria bacterium]|nr:HAD family phosphatase [Candidatus Curtissbacteria bacterium]
MAIRAAIFDFDGVLVNSPEFIAKAYEEFLRVRGKDPNIDHSKFMGRTGIANMRILKEKYGLEGEAENLLAERRAISDSLWEENMALMDGVRGLLERLKSKGIRCGIASSARRDKIKGALVKFGVDDFFEVIVSEEDVTNGKPNPEVFLMAAEKLGVAPENCVVVEDALHGVEGAKAAGMKVVFVPDVRFTKARHEKADVILKNLDELTDEVMDSL